MFVLLKIYRIPRDHPLAWQMAFIDSEINDVLRGSFHTRVAKPQPKEERKEKEFVSRRELDEEEVCPICYEEMEASDLLIYCRSGCGRNLHSKCMKVWAKHQREKSISESVTCPLCRVPWTPDDLKQLIAPKKAKQKKKEKQKEGHIGICCHGCSQNPIIGARYKCSLCNEFNLCENCFKEKQIHPQHPFVFRAKPLERSRDRKEQWFPAERISNNLARNDVDFSVPYMNVRSLSNHNQASSSSSTAHLEAVHDAQPRTETSQELARNPFIYTSQLDNSPVEPVPEGVGQQSNDTNAQLLQLQYRDIDPNDYETLIQLHEEERKVSCLPRYAIDMLPCRTLDLLPEADNSTGVCSVCLESFELSQIIKTLPCHHEFHKHCIDEWLSKHSDSCALCNQAVFQSEEEPPLPISEPSLGNDHGTIIITDNNESETSETSETSSQNETDLIIGSASAPRSIPTRTRSITKGRTAQSTIRVRPSALSKQKSVNAVKREYVESPTPIRTMVIAGTPLQSEKISERSMSPTKTTLGKVNKERVSRIRNHDNPTSLANASDLVVGDGPVNQRLALNAGGNKSRIPPRKYTPTVQHNKVLVRSPSAQLDTLLLVSQRTISPADTENTPHAQRHQLISRSKSTGAITKRHPLIRGHGTSGVTSTLRRLD